MKKIGHLATVVDRTHRRKSLCADCLHQCRHRLQRTKAENLNVGMEGLDTNPKLQIVHRKTQEETTMLTWQFSALNPSLLPEVKTIALVDFFLFQASSFLYFLSLQPKCARL